MESLNTQTVVTQFNTPSSTYSTSGSFKVEVPQSSVMMAKPLSYQFRVAEYVDETGNIVKVGLQVQIWEHDNYGGAYPKKDWTDVERVQLPYTT